MYTLLVNIVRVEGDNMNLPTTSKEEIISVCQKIAQEKGLSSVNMRSVASECNVSVGAIYNYFPSKTELICETIESIWKDIFFMHGKHYAFTNFVECLSWLFESVQKGREKYPEFLSMHAIAFTTNNKQDGQKIMKKYFVHIKKSLYMVLKSDKNVRKDAFDENLDENTFVDYIFRLFISSIIKSDQEYKSILEIVKRCIY